MPYELALPIALRNQRWKAKIREGERCEEPHVSIIRRTRTWRLGLRDREFLDGDPPPRDVPAALVSFVCDHLDELRAAWDRMYPENPVGEGR